MVRDAGVAELVDAEDLKARRKGLQVNALLACRPFYSPSSPRSARISDRSGHPDGHLIRESLPAAAEGQVQIDPLLESSALDAEEAALGRKHSALDRQHVEELDVHTC